MPSSARADHWPPRWVRKHGAIYYRPPAAVQARWDGKAWFRLGTTEPEAWATWYARTEVADEARTMADVLDTYARRELPKLAPKSQKDYARTLLVLRQVFGKMLPGHVRPTHVAKMMDRMAPVARPARPAGRLMTRTLVGRLIDINQARELLRLVHAGGHTADSMAEAMGLGRATAYRLLARLESALGVRVEVTAEGLRVASWGGLRKAWVLGD